MANEGRFTYPVAMYDHNEGQASRAGSPTTAAFPPSRQVRLWRLRPRASVVADLAAMKKADEGFHRPWRPSKSSNLCPWTRRPPHVCDVPELIEATTVRP